MGGGIKPHFARRLTPPPAAHWWVGEVVGGTEARPHRLTIRVARGEQHFATSGPGRGRGSHGMAGDGMGCSPILSKAGGYQNLTFFRGKESDDVMPLLPLPEEVSGYSPD